MTTGMQEFARSTPSTIGATVTSPPSCCRPREASTSDGRQGRFGPRSTGGTGRACVSRRSLQRGSTLNALDGRFGEVGEVTMLGASEASSGHVTNHCSRDIESAGRQRQDRRPSRNYSA